MSRLVHRSFLTAASLIALVAVVAFAPAAGAQATGRIRGVITEAGSQTPISDAQVSVVGTQQGAVTGGNGRFTIDNVPAGVRQLRVRKIGFSVLDVTVTVPAGVETTSNVSLRVAPTQLGEVVVTGTPLAQEKRTIGNAITQLDVADITDKSSSLNVIDILQARTPGLTILPNSGIPGSAPDINLRGVGSFTTNKPVIYIDGVRLNTESLGNFDPSGQGLASFAAQQTSALDAVNPNDIESIEVIKGPAAATLYGADAAGGVIQIITKKGTRGQQKLRWTAKFERGTSEWGTATPVNYTTCDAGKVALRDAAGNPIWPGCQTVPLNTVLTDDPMQRDPAALREGTVQRTQLSTRGGGDRFSFFLSGEMGKEQGYYFNSYNKRRSGRANFNLAPSDKVDFTLNFGFTQTHLRLPLGDESAQALLFSGARGLPGRVATNSPGWGTISPEQTNRYNNQLKSDRMTVGSTIKIDPTSWFKNRLTLGLDLTTSFAQLLAEPASTDSPLGLTAHRTPRTHIYSMNYAGSVVRPFRSNLESTTSFGAQATSTTTETLQGSGSGLAAPDVTLIQSAVTLSARNDFSEYNEIGFFVQEQLGWNNRLFVTGALRADDHSSFGTDFDIITYPKAMVSWVMTEEPFFGRFFDRIRADEFKFRTAWGAAGRAPAPYAATQTYTVGTVAIGPNIGSSLRTGAFGNPGLKPERGSELEIGFDAGFLNRRVGVEFTWYNKMMRDVLVPVAAPPSTGFASNIFTNFGAIDNKGTELSLNVIPISGRTLNWDARINFSTNNNELITFGDSRTKTTPPSQAYGVVQEHRVGFPLAGYWARLPLRNADGTPQIDPTTLAVVLDTATYIGPSQPRRQIGFSNTLTLFKNWRAYASFDYKGGHYLFNGKERTRCLGAINNCERANDPRVLFPQTAEDTLLSKELPVWRSVNGVYIEKADFIKLRDLSLTYTLPASVLGRFNASTASVTIVGHNLAMWTDYSGLDPEVNTYGIRQFVRVDQYAAPMTKRVTLQLNLGF